jgi:hypothetical protein
MSVATFVQSNYTSDTGTSYPLKLDAAMSVATRFVDCFAPHQATTANMTVLVDAGSIYTKSTFTLLNTAQQTTATLVAPVTNPRIDRVVITLTTGAVSVIHGTESATPTPPAFVSGVIPICQVALTTSTIAISNSMLTDERSPYIL